jgi:hypothetical protein
VAWPSPFYQEPTRLRGVEAQGHVEDPRGEDQQRASQARWTKEATPMKARIVWYLRQLLPLHYRTRYRDSDGNEHFVVWQMFLGRCYAIDDVIVG